MIKKYESSIFNIKSHQYIEIFMNGETTLGRKIMNDFNQLTYHVYNFFIIRKSNHSNISDGNTRVTID